MLLIVILGLIVKITLVSGDCDFGNQTLHNFSWTKFSGDRHWYLQLQTSRDFVNEIECPVGLFTPHDGNTSLFTTNVYDTREHRHIIQYGYIRNVNSTGYYEQYHTNSEWTGLAKVIATDYDRYAIFHFCVAELNQLFVYVMYRSSHPEEETVKDVLKELQENNLNISQFVKFRQDYCP